MVKCMACSKKVLLSTSFGKVDLCRNCGSLVEVSTWNDRNFDSLTDLINKKDSVIQKAKEGKFCEEIITQIGSFFDEYINDGFVTVIDGKAGQTLRVFADYCIVNTKNESKKEELEEQFYYFEEDDEEDDDDELVSSADKKNIVSGLMSGKLVSTGIGVALSAKLNQEEKEKAAAKKAHERRKKRERLFTVGDKRIELKKMISVETYSRSGVENGYLKFVPKGVSSSNIYKCEYFFFNNSKLFVSKKIKHKVEDVKNTIADRIASIKLEEKRAIQLAEEKKAEQQAAIQAEQVRRMVEEVTQQNKSDAFEEIRKYKQLFDEGIISEDEFNLKKKELLGL